MMDCLLPFPQQIPGNGVYVSSLFPVDSRASSFQMAPENAQKRGIIRDDYEQAIFKRHQIRTMHLTSVAP